MVSKPLGRLRFLYVGSASVPDDLAFYHERLGARTVWDYTAFGARVAAVVLGEGPLVLLADHRHAPSCMPVYEVSDLDAAVREFRRRGAKPAGRKFEIPNGPCYLFKDPSGNEFAVFEDVRPHALE